MYGYRWRTVINCAKKLIRNLDKGDLVGGIAFNDEIHLLKPNEIK